MNEQFDNELMCVEPVEADLILNKTAGKEPTSKKPANKNLIPNNPANLTIPQIQGRIHQIYQKQNWSVK